MKIELFFLVEYTFQIEISYKASVDISSILRTHSMYRVMCMVCARSGMTDPPIAIGKLSSSQSM